MARQANADLILGVWSFFGAFARSPHFWLCGVVFGHSNFSAGLGGAEQSRDFVLHAFHFIKTEPRIADYENVGAGAVFVNQDRAISRFLGFDLFQNAFAL